MRERKAQLEAALASNAAILFQAELLIAATESDRAAIINELIALFGGPQREAERLTSVARWAREKERPGGSIPRPR